MTLPTNINDREMAKFHDVSDGVTAVKVTGSDGSALASETTLAAIQSSLPSTLGQKTMAQSLSTVIASNQSDVPVKVWGNTAAISPRKTFSASANFSPASPGSDVFTVYGPSSGAIYITKLTVSGTQTTGANADILLFRRSTQNSGGVFSTITSVPHVAGDTTTAVVKAYTTNPSPVGTFVGTVHQEKVFTPAPGNPGGILVWTANDYCKPIILNSPNYGFCVNFNGITRTGNVYCITVEFFQI